MKKTRFVILLSFIFVFQVVNSQEIKSLRVAYSVKKTSPPDYLEKIENNFDYSEDQRQTLKMMHYLNTPVNGVLEFKNDKSLYQVSEKDVEKNREKRVLGINLSFIFGGSKKIYFSNISENIQFYKAKNLAAQDELVYFDKYKWELINEEQEILGYNCKKAIKIFENKKSETIVWFTEDIPIGIGPKLHLGLPGLVLKVESRMGSFLATKVEVNPKNLEIVTPKAEIITTLKEKRKAFQNIMQGN